MSKIILEFDGNTEEDVANLAMKVVSFWSDVDDIRDKMRNHLKYDQETTIEELYKDICRIMEEYPLS